MRAVDYLVNKLIQMGVTDVFGIPGGVVLDLLYALEDKKQQICPHLVFHEQAAGFAAIGYAQTNGTLGVAYATRGPGFTNLVTAIADAYQESVPVLFITAHSQQNRKPVQRMEVDQEIDAAAMAENITKYAARIDLPSDFIDAVDAACQCAIQGRHGPVLLDVYSSLWTQEVKKPKQLNTGQEYTDIANLAEVYRQVNESKRPIILAGNGVQQSKSAQLVQKLSEALHIPILTSRCSQDLFSAAPTYFGYIGSHGLRYSNFILSKADLIFALGNRMAFPIRSKSFRQILEQARIIQVDVDQAELTKEFPNCERYHADLNHFFRGIDVQQMNQRNDSWLNVCHRLKEQLFSLDTEYPVDVLSDILMQLPQEFTIVADVGNHEFWVSRAYAYAGTAHRILYSRAFGALGNALPKSVGVYYKTTKPVLCILGDQGFQMNIQELQFIVANRLPIVILLLNNKASGMIHTHEQQKYGGRFVHTTQEDGYSVPDFGAIALTYGLSYQKVTGKMNVSECIAGQMGPCLLEMEINKSLDLNLTLPQGNPCQDMAPELPREVYQELDNL